VETESELTIVNNRAANRYEAALGGRPAGYSTYEEEPGRVTFVHTVVRPAFEGRGVGSRLAKFAIDDVRSRGLRITPVCPFVRAYLRRHHEYDSIVDYPVEE
jgi:predicted GNAT family acetyltransferase